MCATRATIKLATLVWAQPQVAQAPSTTPPKPAQIPLSPAPPPAPTRVPNKEDPRYPKSSGEPKQNGALYSQKASLPGTAASEMKPSSTKDLSDGNELPARIPKTRSYREIDSQGVDWVIPPCTDKNDLSPEGENRISAVCNTVSSDEIR